MVCEPIFKKLKKNVPVVWDDKCQESFDKIKAYLVNPPVLAPALPDIPLRLYLTVTKETMGAMLAQEVEVLETALSLGVKKLRIFGDSSLIINQISKRWKIYANLQHVPPSLLYTYTSPWPFSTWGININGKITPPRLGGHEYILVTIDYFTKWVEAALYAKLKAKHVFIKRNIIRRYGVPHEMINDNGTHFQAKCEDLLKKYGIQHHHSSPHRPEANGAVEAANKNFKIIIEKMTKNYKDWPDKLHFSLWGYRTSIRSSTGTTPFSLVYGMDVVQPVELEIPSLRIAL
ncbi:uncharacterized protein K02A2.6-like [Chenopodium quinoa]|uniref:uncharacterized protein K02A2.6-like n=1 Tax=Chenopodium quinoa TaxID=63459 RepID=UPI000B796544|nr:uncharacterized protein K02A2.6-like [Chenopodium quinoa]